MAEIKISELSIGDWVNQKMNDGAYQVQWIEREMVGLIKHTGTEEDGSIRLTAVPLSFIEPITLTPEILEKNGFVYSRVTRWYKCELKDTLRTTIGVHYGLIGADRIEISSADAFDEDWNTIDVMINKPIKGVHQLQNALRLAGVEKEIEL